MPDELRSPIKHHLVLHRIDPGQGIRFLRPVNRRIAVLLGGADPVDLPYPLGALLTSLADELPLHLIKASVLSTTPGAAHQACGFDLGR